MASLCSLKNKFFSDRISLLLLMVLAQACREDFLYLQNNVNTELEIQEHYVSELSESNKLDLLWVVDNSNSMSPYQNQIIKNAFNFIDPFVSKNKGIIDWKLGLISTDPEDLPYLGFGTRKFDSNTPNPVFKFQSAIKSLGVYGSGFEQSFAPLINILEAYPDFLRAGSDLVLVFVTDADEQSNRKFPYVSDFIARLKLIKPEYDRISAFGIFGFTEMGCPEGTGEHPGSYRGSRFEEFFAYLTHSTVFPICKDDYGTTLSEIGNSIVSRLSKLNVYLKYRPRAGSIKVYYADQELPGGQSQTGAVWSYNSNQNVVRLHSLDLSKISKSKSGVVRVTYQREESEEWQE